MPQQAFSLPLPGKWITCGPRWPSCCSQRVRNFISSGCRQLVGVSTAQWGTGSSLNMQRGGIVQPLLFTYTTYKPLQPGHVEEFFGCLWLWASKSIVCTAQTANWLDDNFDCHCEWNWGCRQAVWKACWPLTVDYWLLTVFNTILVATSCNEQQKQTLLSLVLVLNATLALSKQFELQLKLKSVYE